MKQEIKDKMMYIRNKWMFHTPQVKLDDAFDNCMIEAYSLAQEEYASKGMRWVKASERLPDTYAQHEKHYRLDGRKSNGILIEAKDGGVVFEFKSGGTYHIMEDLSLLEWLDETTDKENEPVAEEKAMEYAVDFYQSNGALDGMPKSIVDDAHRLAALHFSKGYEYAKHKSNLLYDLLKDHTDETIHAQADRIKELEAENEILKMENSHSKLVVDEAKREIERLRGVGGRSPFKRV